MESTIKNLSERFNLSVEFLTELHDKIVDKENFTRAVRMFMDGLMPYDIATGKEPINVAELRHKVAADIVAFRKDKTAKIRAAFEQQKRIQEYYSGCKSIRYPKKPKGGVSDIAFIKNGRLVALAHFEPSAGGIYAADNEVMPGWNWRPHEYLARLRKLNKAFYREIKKAAVNSPREWFDFNATTK